MGTEKAIVNVYGNIWVREMIFPHKGDIKRGHRHQFDHLHFVAKGKVNIQIKDANDNIIGEEEHVAGDWIKVPKEVYHSVIALEDNSVGYCIQALRDEQGEVMETDYLKDLEEEAQCIECNNPIQKDIL